MTEHSDEHDQVGSVGEEAAKLLGAFSEWARDHGVAGSGSDQRSSEDPVADAARAAERGAAGFAEAFHEVSEHVATDDEACRYCPLCQVIHAVRDTSPEVRQHLGDAAGSLLHAAAGFLAAQGYGAGARRENGPSGVEKIDLADDDGWGEDRS